MSWIHSDVARGNLWLILITDSNFVATSVFVYLVRPTKQMRLILNIEDAHRWLFIYSLHCLIKDFCDGTAVERVSPNIDFHVVQHAGSERGRKWDVGRAAIGGGA